MALSSAKHEAIHDKTGDDLAAIKANFDNGKHLDAINFPGGINPLGTPDPTAEFPQEIYKIDRKASENREVVTFELAAVFDLVGVIAPKRQVTKKDFPSIGTFIS